MQCRKFVYEFAETNGIAHPFNKETKMAGEDWLSKFMKDFNFTMRTPEATSIGRMMGFNKPAVDNFFRMYREVRLSNGFSPQKIYNADESGLSTVPNKQPKVISPKGTRRVAKVASAERGRNITVVCSMSATGVYVPPFLIFPRKRMKPELLDGLPPGAVGQSNESGWMNSEMFVVYLQHFVNHVKPSKGEPVLLLVDNHSSHISLQAVNFCRDNGIVMVGLPPHTSHRLQPLDVSFFGPLKAFYSQACDNYLVSHPGQQITETKLGNLFTAAYSKAATVGNAIKGFEATGIEPFNPQIFQECDFAAAATSERILPISEGPAPASKSNSCDNSSNDVRLHDNASAADSAPQSPNNVQLEHNLIEEAEPSSGKTNVSSCRKKVSFYELKPLPVAERTTATRKRPIGSASVITSSPVKNMLLQKDNEKKKKEEKRKERNVNKTKKQSSEYSVSKPSSQNSVSCPACEEDYVDPPDEDWIQCSACSEWWHETCSNYEGGGRFVCDYCS